METLRIAFYGKGGIGKSTIAAHTAAAFALQGKKVLFIGCDPKADSSRTIVGRKIKSVLECMMYYQRPLQKEDIVQYGFAEIACIECGGPSAGKGCAGLGITATLKELNRLKIFEEKWDIIIYDVLGDVVCGGFSVPIRDGLIDRMFIVTSEEYMSLYASNNLLKSVENFSSHREPFFGGFIYNAKDFNTKSKIMEVFAEKVNSKVLISIPYISIIKRAEWEGKTLLQKDPKAKEIELFVSLTRRILEEGVPSLPKAIDDEGMEALYLEVGSCCEVSGND